MENPDFSQAEERLSAKAQAEQGVSDVVEQEQEITPIVVTEEVIPVGSKAGSKAVEEAFL